ncbi:sulfur carrier protein ThiS [Terrabacter sp. MAHUQ-38]|uniref:sulfur carrier protein ThiS n=1 Tax=unclassified Terrabacter TaxID=2630222 RepID=UPI00165E256E|nr:sulfur carrier protein ThiS [Terrabacter sp. MAHUQ-38]
MNISLNGEERIVRPGATVNDLVEELGVPTRGVAVALDHVIVPRSAWARTVVKVGARVDVVTAMQGG